MGGSKAVLFPAEITFQMLAIAIKLKPPDLADRSLLTVEIRDSGVRHVVSIIDQS